MLVSASFHVRIAHCGTGFAAFGAGSSLSAAALDASAASGTCAARIGDSLPSPARTGGRLQGACRAGSTVAVGLV